MSWVMTSDVPATAPASRVSAAMVGASCTGTIRTWLVAVTESCPSETVVRRARATVLSRAVVYVIRPSDRKNSLSAAVGPVKVRATALPATVTPASLVESTVPSSTASVTVRTGDSTSAKGRAMSAHDSTPLTSSTTVNSVGAWTIGRSLTAVIAIVVAALECITPQTVFSTTETVSGTAVASLARGR